jgi:hypothetical protein
MNGQIDNQTSSNNWGPPDLITRSRGLWFLPELVRGAWAGTSIFKDMEHQILFVDTEFQNSLDILKSRFIFNNAEAVEDFLRNHRGLASVLLEAAPHMKKAFGEETPLALEIMQEDGSPRVIYALARWRGGRAESRNALNSFDESWLMSNLKKSAGRIVFDYELI